CPALADRPLVMKRYPNGIAGQWFYQHRVDDVPAGVRTEVVRAAERRAQIIGGTLKTLLYTTQLAAISQDPWFSRVDHPECADHVALDLDPSEGVPFARVHVDFLQNILGKTLAAAYSARASDYAGVSTPLTWKEVDAGVDRRDFTIETVPSRLQEAGDLWAALRESAGVDLSRMQRYAE